MSQQAVPLQHPLERCVATVSAALADAVGSSPTYLSTSAKRRVLTALSRQIAQLEGLRLAVVAVAGDVADEDAARSAGAWVAVDARLEGREGRRLQKLAEALEGRYGVLASALVEGEVSRPQAEVIVKALDALPADLDVGLRGEAERHLVDQAREFGPRDLRVLGQRVLEVVAPEVAEEIEEAALRKSE